MTKYFIKVSSSQYIYIYIYSISIRSIKIQSASIINIYIYIHTHFRLYIYIFQNTIIFYINNSLFLIKKIICRHYITDMDMILPIWFQIQACQVCNVCQSSLPNVHLVFRAIQDHLGKIPSLFSHLGWRHIIENRQHPLI